VSNTFERNTPVAASVSTSIGFTMMCVGKFMAILDVQVVATSLPTIQSALDIPPDQMKSGVSLVLPARIGRPSP
jgi:hypothetical protein